MDIFHYNVQKRFHRLVFAAFAFITAVLYDILIWKHAHGFGFLIFIFAYLVGFLALIAWKNHVRQIWSVLLLIPVVVLSFDVILFNNNFVYTAVPAITLFLLLFFSLISTLEKPADREFYISQVPLIKKGLAPLFTYIGVMFSDLNKKKEKIDRTRYKKLMVGIIIALPLVIIFTVLFASADQIFADYLQRGFDIDMEPSTVWRILRTIVMCLFLSGFFYVLLGKDHIMSARKYLVEKFDDTIVNTVLIVLNILFAIFVFIQFKFLFGSYEYVLNNSIIFSEYAREGFFQLLWAVLFAGLIFLIVYRSFAYYGMKSFLSAMHVLFVLQTGVIAVSALKRMNLYQEAYGYTVQRLYVEWFVYFVIALLVLAILNVLLKWKFKRLIHVGFGVGLIAFMVVSSINVDYKIAHKNISRFIESGKDLDVEYLKELSVDILPAFTLLQDEKAKDLVTIEQAQDIQDLFKDKTEDLKARNGQLDFNWGLYKARDVLPTLSGIYAPFVEKINKYNDKREWAVRNSVNPYSCQRSICHNYKLGGLDVGIKLKKFNTPIPHNDPKWKWPPHVTVLIWDNQTQTYIYNSDILLLEGERFTEVRKRYGGQVYPNFFLLNDGRIIEFLPEEGEWRYLELDSKNGKFIFNVVTDF